MMCEKHIFNFRKVRIMKMLSSLKAKLASFTTDESGATLIEYGLLAALIAVFLVVALQTLGNKVSGTLSNVGAVL
jgi:pilus assembly protein Flp/PilA